jgi:hypothetical protein
MNFRRIDIVFDLKITGKYHSSGRKGIHSPYSSGRFLRI